MSYQKSKFTLGQWVGKTLSGLEEIHQALVFVDCLPEEKRNGAWSEVYEYNHKSNVTVRFYTFSNVATWDNIVKSYQDSIGGCVGADYSKT